MKCILNRGLGADLIKRLGLPNRPFDEGDEHDFHGAALDELVAKNLAIPIGKPEAREAVKEAVRGEAKPAPVAVADSSKIVKADKK